MNKVEALSKFLNCPDNIESLSNNLFEAGRAKYLVLTDAGADELCGEYITESLWSFSPWFLISHMPFAKDLTRHEQECFSDTLATIQENLCESANTIIKALVGDNLSSLISDAIASDGRGHFLSECDGEELEEGKYFIYRVN